MEIRVLGGLAVTVDGRDLPLGTPKQQLVLGMLALHTGRAVTVESLVDELWPEEPPRSAVANVRTYAANLRRTFEKHRGPNLSRLGGAYRLESTTETVDAFRFTRYVEAAERAWAAGDMAAVRASLGRGDELWGGPLLAGTTTGPVLAARRAALDEQRLSAVELRARLDLRTGRFRAAISSLTDHLATHPYREQAHALLVRALYADGDPAEALAAARRAEQALLDHLGIAAGPELKLLRRRILNREPLPEPVQPDSEARPPAPRRDVDRPGGAAGPARVNRLPRLMVDFVGRRELMAQLVAELAAAAGNNSPVRVIDGMAGSGKTSFAVQVAHRLAGSHPDAQLFIDLRGHAEGVPVDPPEALTALLRQLGVPAGRIPTDHALRTELWQAELGARRAVVVLDNAASSEQVAPLLPDVPGAVVLVTSRRRLSLGPPVPLPALTPQEAVELLARTAGAARVEAEPQAAAEVVRCCGHLPLAIRLAGGRLLHRPTWRVADLARRLSSGTTVLRQLAVEQQTVASAFTASYEPLGEPLKRMFRLLSVHPGGWFDAPMAAALADLPLDRADCLLEELLDQHLIEEAEPGRYRLHDLMRQYSVELSRGPQEADDRAAAGRRLLDHVLHEVAGRGEDLEPVVLSRHLRLDPPGRPDLLGSTEPADVEWLERERANLVSLIKFAVEGPDPEYGWRLARAMWRFCYIRGYFDDILATHHAGLVAAERSGDRAAQAMMHNYLASAYTRTGGYLDAQRNLEAAVSAARELRDHFNEHRYRANLVVIHWLTGELERAVDLARQLLRERPGGVAVESPLALANLGIALTALGRYPEAQQAHRLHLYIGRCRGNLYDVANALGHLGAVENRLGNHHKAIRLTTASLRLRTRTGHRYAEAEVRNDLGIAYRRLGRLAEARAQHELALDLAVDSGERHVQAAALNDLGATLALLGDSAAAVDAHRRALELATRITHRYEQGRALAFLADHLDEPNPEAARRHRRRALVIFQRLRVPERTALERRLAEPVPEPEPEPTGTTAEPG
ncbi:AfsR/SARP family transcriptional regulator [Micromonospora auratinigra]|uniref:DNA-binding transcriptional activator of the SARP family n=1 Tax=Micromonospora auratinigra TaxID=261654 RepID=A0A1A9A0C0_9ACTN|nr:BTAD domain-containing putative transcriptional regulator [Micromonospora auratinigra]SBT49644.1 DNA-binding transcriptional activator of the SARP family [Micromonospora auratinigra]